MASKSLGRGKRVARKTERPEKKPFPLRLRLWVIDALRDISEEEDVSMNEVARRIIEKHLRERMERAA